MRDKICVLLGGHKAEKHFLGPAKLSTNCTEDLKKATDLAYSMVRQFGMEEERFGLVSAPKEALSQAGNAKVDAAVREIVNVIFRDNMIIGSVGEDGAVDKAA